MAKLNEIFALGNKVCIFFYVFHDWGEFLQGYKSKYVFFPTK